MFDAGRLNTAKAEVEILSTSIEGDTRTEECLRIEVSGSGFFL
jgi:hypothetical protein